MSFFEQVKIADTLDTVINPATKENQATANSLITNVTDLTSNTLKVVDHSHADLHIGNHYTYRGYHAVAKAGSIDHLIITPNTTRWAHMTIGLESSAGELAVELFEDATVSANGTIENTINRNRNVADNNITLIYVSPTVTTTGTLLTSIYLGAGRKLPGGSERDNEEIVLKQNTIYLFRVVEQNIAATKVSITFDWYEHTNI